MCINFAVVLLVCALALNLIQFSDAGVMHSHSNDVHKERESDGAYSPRDHSHFSDSGEHHNEFDHEVILGSHKEAEEYDHLSPEEAKRRLRILLKKMDLNDDQQVDKKELKTWILRSFKMLSEEEANERLEDADEDNNGLVTWQEYLSDAYGMDNEENLSIGDENDQLIRDDKEMWKAADINNDGVLDSKEWNAFSHPEEHPSMLPIILEQTLREKDKDGDRFISFQEFVGDRAEEHDKDWLQVEKDKFDSDLDKDGDGKLSSNEILSWVVPSNE
jgi:Ca2+-binding EF-hand superfamily protein